MAIVNSWNNNQPQLGANTNPLQVSTQPALGSLNNNTTLGGAATAATRTDGGSRNGGGTYRTGAGSGAGGATGTTNTPPVSPWAPNVTATNWDGSQMSLANPNNPNINYITGDAARALGTQYGGNIVTGGATTGGAIDQPLYGLDLGFGDPFSAGQVQFMKDRGDSEAQIRAHLTHPAMWWANGADPNGVRNSDVQWNFSSPFANNLGTGGVNQSALARTAANQTAFGRNGSVNTQMSVPNVVPQGASGQAPSTSNAGAGNAAALSFLMQLLGPQFLTLLLGGGGSTQRPPQLSGTARVGNRYRTYEPRYY